MVNYIITPYMGLTNPTTNQPGPLYAVNIFGDLNIIDAHAHTGAPGGGKQINIAGQVIQGDLELDGYNLGMVRSVQYLNNPATLTGSQDVNSVYVADNVLYFNNNNGVPQALSTTSGSTPFTNLGLITINGSYTILPTALYNYVACDLGAASTLTLPIASAVTPTAIGRLFFVADVGDTFTANPLTIAAAGGNTINYYGVMSSSIVLNTNGQSVLLVSDGVSEWEAFPYAINAYHGQALTFTDSTITMDSASTLTNNGATNLNGLLTIFGTTIFENAVTFNSLVKVLDTNLQIGDGTLESNVLIESQSVLEMLSDSTLNFISGSKLTGTITIPTGSVNINATGSGALFINAPIALPAVITSQNTTITVPNGNTLTINETGTAALDIQLPTVISSAGSLSNAGPTTLSGTNTFSGQNIVTGLISGGSTLPAYNSQVITVTSGTIIVTGAYATTPYFIFNTSLTGNLTFNFNGAQAGTFAYFDLTTLTMNSHTLIFVNGSGTYNFTSSFYPTNNKIMMVMCKDVNSIATLFGA
jgi:hypothetical protein